MRLHNWVRSELFGPLHLQSFASLHSSPTVLALSLVLCTHHPFSVVMAFSVKKACIFWWKKNSVLQSVCSCSILWSTQATKVPCLLNRVPCALFILMVCLCFWVVKKPDKIVEDKNYSDVQDLCHRAIFYSCCHTKQIGNIVQCALWNWTFFGIKLLWILLNPSMPTTVLILFNSTLWIHRSVSKIFLGFSLWVLSCKLWTIELKFLACSFSFSCCICAIRRAWCGHFAAIRFTWCGWQAHWVLGTKYLAEFALGVHSMA
jgi:hypothetical protein